jgi:hypothetical protein
MTLDKDQGVPFTTAFGLYSGTVTMYQTMDRVIVTVWCRAHPFDMCREPEMSARFDLPAPPLTSASDIFVAALQEVCSALS